MYIYIDDESIDDEYTNISVYINNIEYRVEIQRRKQYKTVYIERKYMYPGQ